MINLGKETDFYQVGVCNNGQENFVCIDDDLCTHDHSFRTGFELPAIIQTTSHFLRHSFMHITEFRKQFEMEQEYDDEIECIESNLKSCKISSEKVKYAEPRYENGTLLPIPEYILWFKKRLTNKIFLSYEYYDTMIDSIIRQMLTEYILNLGSGNGALNGYKSIRY